MFRIIATCLLSLLSVRVLAIHGSEAGIVDWYKPLIGDALTGNPSLSPVFHRVGEVNEPTKSYILTATTSNVLAALHPENGTIAWRHLFEDKDHIVSFKRHKKVVATASGTGGATVRLLDVSTGELLLERQLHAHESGRLLEPGSAGVTLAFDSNPTPHLYTLTNGHTVRRVSTLTGEVQWGWTSPDQTSLILYTTVVPTSSAVYIFGLAKSLASYTLHITTLSPSDGSVLADVDIPSNIKSGPESVLAISRRTGDGNTVLAVWLEDGVICSVVLTPELNEKPTRIKGSVYQKIINIGLEEFGLFVALQEDGSGRVIKLNEQGGGLKVIWEFADSMKAAHYTDSHYTGGLDKDGYPYIARVFWSHAYKQASAHIFAPHLAGGKGLVTGFTFPFATSMHGIIGHVAVDAANPEEYRVLARLVITSTTGAIQLWQQDQLQWTREEGLTDIKVAEFVELPERQIALGEGTTGETTEKFAVRVQRQLLEAQGFPQYVLNFAKRFVTGSYDTVTSAVVSLNDTSALVRDAFGFRKVLVVATGRGKVYGIDSANGEIVWSRVLGLGWAAEVGGRIFPLKIYTTRAVSDGDTPQVVLITQRQASNGLVDTVLFHLDALTGEDSTYASPTDGLLQGFDAIAGSLVEAYPIRDGGHKYVLLFDEFLQTHIYPDTPEHQDSFQKLIPSLHFALRTGQPGATRLTGHRISARKEFTGKYVAQSVWTTSLPESEDIQAVITRLVEPVASFGKVLGNRTTLYKYLNPNAIVVLTSSLKSAPPACGVYLMDAAKGTTLYHSVLPAVGGVCDVKAAFTENWLVYAYYDNEGGVDQVKSHRIVSVEFYEGHGIDKKTGSSDLSSYSHDTINFNIYEQAYVLPRAVTAIAMTTTKYGIASKEIIVAEEGNLIQGFPRRFLDPRRPKHKPSNQELEEWLIQYEPLLPDDPKRVLSHTYQVARTQKIITSPALLESTSLIFTYGLDLFSTRTAPSNTFDVLSETFNKVQLVLTIAGLSLAILVTKPMVRRKKLRERWYN